jgi:hypothetical protein
MPQYVPVVFGATGLTLVAAIIAPAPRMSLDRAANACRLLLALGLLALFAAITLPAFDVWYPALAVVGAAFGVWFGMFWLARQPGLDEPVASSTPEGTDEDDGGHGGGGGGGGPSDPDDRPDPPAPRGGLDWDSFDRERRDWETRRAPGRERELVGV